MHSKATQPATLPTPDELHELAIPYFERLNWEGPQQITLADIGLVAVIAPDFERQAELLEEAAESLRAAIDDLEAIRQEGRMVSLPSVTVSGSRHPGGQGC